MTLHILLVENDPLCRVDLAETLEDFGHVVTQVANGRHALSALRRATHRPDVILLDLSTPEMSGWEFRNAQLADASHAQIPVIVVSGHVEVEREARLLGARGWLRKPFSLDALADALEADACVPALFVTRQPDGES